MADLEKTINIRVEKLVPTLLEGCKEILCGNGDYIVHFLFDEEWSEYNVKTALFVCGDTTYASVFEGDYCEVPEIDGGMICFIGVVSGDYRNVEVEPKKKTTRWVEVGAIPTITSIAKEPSAPSNDVYVQFMALLNKYIEQGGGTGGGGTTSGLDEEAVKNIVAEETKNLSGVKVGGEFVKEFDADTKFNAPAKYAPLDNIIVRESNGNVIGAMVDAGYGIAVIKGATPRLICSSCSRDQILKKAETSKPITPDYIDLAVKVGVSTNTIPLADEEKQNAQNWLGIGDHEKRIENLESTLLDYPEDTAIAYEKSVPSDVAPYAVLDKVGGNSIASTNLLNPALFKGTGISAEADGSVKFHYWLTGVGGYTSAYAVVRLEKGTYCLSGVNGKVTNVELGGLVFAENYSNKITLTEARDVEINLELTVDESGEQMGNFYIMLNEGESAEPFMPYFEGLRHAPVTEIISKDTEGGIIQTVVISEALRNACGENYGKAHTYIDFDTKQFVDESGDSVKRKDISTHLTDYKDFKELRVQGGGRIVFENEHKIAVPSTITYVKRKG